MYDLRGGRKIFGPDYSAKVIAAAKCNMKAQLFIKQHLADGKNTEITKYAKADFSDITVGRLCLNEFFFDI